MKHVIINISRKLVALSSCENQKKSEMKLPKKGTAILLWGRAALLFCDENEGCAFQRRFMTSSLGSVISSIA
jgi:hypothetical protein